MIIAKGAEASITFDGKNLVKERIPKSYRISQIDNSLRKFRTKREAKVIQTLNSKNVPAPKFISLDEKSMKIEMEYIDGKKLRDILEKDLEKYSRELGRLVAFIHNIDIIHGDLTTSNMIVADKMYLIDFGLSFFSNKVEDKAVDLHLLKQAIESKHCKVFEKSFDFILDEYRKNCRNADEVLKRFKQVELRGRNKVKY